MEIERILQRLLEIGCGMGFDLAEWSKRGLLVTGIDLAPNAIQMAKKYFAYQGLAVDLRVGNALQLGFPNDSFDIVYSKGVLHHVPDIRQAINEIRRVLKPGGKALLLNFYHKYSWFVFLHKIGRENIEFVERDAPIINFYTKNHIRSILSDFVSLKISLEHYYPVPTLREGLKAKLFNHVFVPVYSSLPKMLARPFGFKLNVKCEKPTVSDKERQ